MKHLIIAISIFGIMTSCGSNKKTASSRYNSIGTAKAPTIAPSKPEASRIPFKANEQADPNLARLDSILGSMEPAPQQKLNYYGASGAGTGGSYASNYYASRKYKKPAAKTQAAAAIDTTLTSQVDNSTGDGTSSW